MVRVIAVAFPFAVRFLLPLLIFKQEANDAILYLTFLAC